MSTELNIQQFLEVMKTKIENKLKNGSSQEKLLLEIFKYYDVSNSE